MKANVPVLGVVGGIASGKSHISDQLARQGASVISADQLAHEVLKLDEVKRAIRERWGDQVFLQSGEVNRQALGQIVFAPPPEGPKELKLLEKMTHPRIKELAAERMERLGQDAATKAIVLDVPLMVEAGWNKYCDKVIFVDAPRDVRLARAKARGWTEDEFSFREAAQESLQTKHRLADVTIDNSGSSESALAQIEQFWNSLLASRPR